MIAPLSFSTVSFHIAFIVSPFSSMRVTFPVGLICVFPVFLIGNKKSISKSSENRRGSLSSSEGLPIHFPSYLLMVKSQKGQESIY